MTSNKKKLWVWLINAGYPPAAAAGILGNIQAESNFDPKAREPGGPGCGICQWGYDGGAHGSNRFNQLCKWAKGAGRDPWALDTQFDWMRRELMTTYHSTDVKLRNPHITTKQAAILFDQEFEGSDGSARDLRIQYARAIRDRFVR